MNGEKIRKKLKERGISFAEISRKLEMSQQNLHAALCKDDVKTGLLERISKAAGIPLAEFYDTPINIAHGNNNTQVSGNGNSVNSDISQLHELLKKKDEQIDRLLTIIEQR